VVFHLVRYMTSYPTVDIVFSFIIILLFQSIALHSNVIHLILALGRLVFRRVVHSLTHMSNDKCLPSDLILCTLLSLTTGIMELLVRLVTGQIFRITFLIGSRDGIQSQVLRAGWKGISYM